VAVVTIHVSSDQPKSPAQTPPEPNKPPIFEAKKKAPTIPCTGCGTQHGGVTETTDCPDCAKKRRDGENIPGTPKDLPHRTIPKNDPVPVRKPAPPIIPKPDPIPIRKKDTND
jgi:hypothetical protein